MLSEAALRAVEVREKPYTLSLGDRLYLDIKPSGKKYWFIRYKDSGVSKKKSLGLYPDVSLKEARRLAVNFEAPQVSDILFRDMAMEWHRNQIADVTDGRYSQRVLSRIERHLLPLLGDIPPKQITTASLLDVLRVVEKQRKIDTAHRIMNYCSQIYRYAIATGRAERNPVAGLRGALIPHKQKHMATLTDVREIRKLLIAMENFSGSFPVYSALWFSAFTFCRPGEIRKAEWSEIDFNAAEWRIPAEKMKMRRMHIVPLATQVIKLLKELLPMTGHGQYVFPSSRSIAGTVPMSENTVLYAIRRMGFGPDEMTAHGFRGLASTRLHEMGYPSHIIERQLAHMDKNSVRSAYNHAEYLSERRKLMQEWADWLERLKESEA